jgi:periplasmic protein TonB
MSRSGVHISKQFTLEDTMVRTATIADGIFADSMLQTSWAQRSRRNWTTLTSFGLQAVIIGLLLLVPLLRTVGVPFATHALPTPLSWGAPEPPAPVQHHVTTVVQSNLADNVMIAPLTIPLHIANIDEPVAPPQVNYNDVGDGVVGNRGSGNGVFGTTPGSIERPVLPPPPAAKIERQFRTSSMLEGSLIHSVQPAYPPLARTARIQGSVVLSAIIAKDGSIEGLHALSGHPLLVTAAVQAVRQWRYRPYILNNEAIEVETQITVNFTLAGN